MFKLSKNSKKNREGIDSRLIEISDLAITITLIDFGHGPYSGRRTTAEQKFLFSNGKSKADGINDIGEHQKGRALDFYAYIDRAGSWKPEHLTVVAAAHLQAASMLGYKITSGMFWKSRDGGIYGWDLCHLQLIGD